MKSGATQRLNVSKCFWSVSNGFLYALDVSQCFWLIWSYPKSYCVGRLESLVSQTVSTLFGPVESSKSWTSRTLFIRKR